MSDDDGRAARLAEVDETLRDTVIRAQAERIERLERERDEARAWSARWKEAARAYRRAARENGAIWMRAHDDLGRLSKSLDRIEAERDALAGQVRALREALLWYADQANYTADGVPTRHSVSHPVCRCPTCVAAFEPDNGRVARAALAGGRGDAGEG